MSFAVRFCGTRSFLCNLRQQVLALFPDQCGQVGGLIVHKRCHAIEVAHSCGKHVAVLIQQGPQGVYIRGALMNQPLPAAEHRRTGLLLNRFGLHKAHLGLAGRDHDRLGIGSIILLALDERANVLWRDQFHLVPKRFHLPRPIVRATAGFEDDQAGSLLGHERWELLSCQLFAELHLPRPQGSVDLKNILRQINSDHHIVHLAVLSVAWP